MGPKVLITGGSGLLAVNWAIAKRNFFDITLAMHRRQITIPGTRSLFMDIESIDSITRTVNQVQPDIVIHTAALTNVDECESNLDLANHINVKISTNLANVCARSKVFLVYLSSDQLFKGDQPFLDETEVPSPLNAYGRTKADAEKNILDLNPKALIIRTNFYGWGTTYRQSFSDFIISNLRLGNRIKLFKDVYYTPILIEVLLLAAHDLLEKNASGIFNLVGDDRISKYEFGLKIAKKFDLNTALIDPGLLAEELNLARRPFDMSLSNQKASKLLNRRIGGVFEHLDKLKAQEQIGIPQELKKL